MDSIDPLLQAASIADAIEQLSDQLTPAVIRAARSDPKGRADLDRIEYALGKRLKGSDPHRLHHRRGERHGQTSGVSRIAATLIKVLPSLFSADVGGFLSRRTGSPL